MKKILVGILCLVILTSMVGMVMAATQPTTATVTVPQFLSVTFTDYPVEFPNMNPGTTTTATAGKGYPLKVNVGSESNVNAKVETKADAANFVSGSYTFPVSNMDWTDDITPTISWTAYSNTIQGTVCASVNPGSACDIYHQLTIPANQAAGAYSVDITITATAA